jgi:spore germination cell wall hydrolase CwlJ-like protein
MYAGSSSCIEVVDIKPSTHTVLVELTKLINSECWSEGFLRKREVLGVIMSRVLHKKFPNSILGVIYDKGQFDGVGTKYFIYTEETYKLVKQWYLEKYVSKYLFFYNPCSSTDTRFIRWVYKKYPNTFFIDNHLFHGE